APPCGGRNHAGRVLCDAASHRTQPLRRMDGQRSVGPPASGHDRAQGVAVAALSVSRFDAVVIRGGLSRLRPAVRLSRRCARVLVLEARARLGGRATAFSDRETGETVDNGQHVLVGCYTETFAFLREIEALGNVRPTPQLAVTMIDRAGERTRLVGSPLPSPL